MSGYHVSSVVPQPKAEKGQEGAYGGVAICAAESGIGGSRGIRERATAIRALLDLRKGQVWISAVVESCLYSLRAPLYLPAVVQGTLCREALTDSLE